MFLQTLSRATSASASKISRTSLRPSTSPAEWKVTLLNKEIQVLELSNKIQSEVKGEMDSSAGSTSCVSS